MPLFSVFISHSFSGRFFTDRSFHMLFRHLLYLPRETKHSKAPFYSFSMRRQKPTFGAHAAPDRQPASKTRTNARTVPSGSPRSSHPICNCLFLLFPPSASFCGSEACLWPCSKRRDCHSYTHLHCHIFAETLNTVSPPYFLRMNAVFLQR